MTDDIVTRLRDEYCDGGYAAPNCGDCVQCKAADEIERLRMELSEAGYEYQKLWERHNNG